jgi:nitrogen fixation NifU-like protein
MMSDLMVDKTPQEAIDLCRLFGRMVRGEETDDSKLAALDEAASLKDVSHMPARVKCAELAWRTLEEMLQNGSDKPGSTATASCVMPPHSHDGQE